MFSSGVTIKDFLVSLILLPSFLPPSANLILQVLLLDEVTVDLDVVARMDLLEFFKQECDQVLFY